MRKPCGTSMIEMMAGALVLIPIVLLAVDGAYVVICSKQNQELADAACRIAANKEDESSARESALNIVARYHKTQNMDSVKVQMMEWFKSRRLVRVVTAMDVTMPVPIPGTGVTHLTAESVHAIVGIPAER
jgi:Flp pilus assembly protein TadG